MQNSIKFTGKSSSTKSASAEKSKLDVNDR